MTGCTAACRWRESLHGIALLALGGSGQASLLWTCCSSKKEPPPCVQDLSSSLRLLQTATEESPSHLPCQTCLKALPLLPRLLPWQSGAVMRQQQHRQTPDALDKATEEARSIEYELAALPRRACDCRQTRAQVMFQLTESGPTNAEKIQPALSQLETGMLYNAEYVISPGRHISANNAVAYGHLLNDAHRRVRPALVIHLLFHEQHDVARLTPAACFSPHLLWPAPCFPCCSWRKLPEPSCSMLRLWHLQV